MTYKALNARNRYIIKLQQHFIFHEQIIGDAVIYLYDGFEIFGYLHRFYLSHPPVVMEPYILSSKRICWVFGL